MVQAKIIQAIEVTKNPNDERMVIVASGHKNMFLCVYESAYYNNECNWYPKAELLCRLPVVKNLLKNLK